LRSLRTVNGVHHVFDPKTLEVLSRQRLAGATFGELEKRTFHRSRSCPLTSDQIELKPI
jgi:hypothetical protein